MVRMTITGPGIMNVRSEDWVKTDSFRRFGEVLQRSPHIVKKNPVQKCLMEAFIRDNPKVTVTMLSCPCPKCTPRC